ncbi:MAG TPA: hypothetical protein VKU89_00995 [Solirubrobacteraceae bacterium]|nr:hypothetical protein [Solirubrobacteraceae bacterium]
MRAADLPPDQLAALSLLLRRGRSPEQIAAALGIDAEAVRARARTAALALAPAGAGLAERERERVADFLLGFGDEAQRLVTLEELHGSEPLRALARELAGALAELSPRPLALLGVIEGGGAPAPAAASAEPIAVAAPGFSAPPSRARTHASRESAARPPGSAGAPGRARPQQLRAAAAQALAASAQGVRSGGSRLRRRAAAAWAGRATPAAPVQASRLGGALLLTAILGGLIAALALSGALGGSGESASAPGTSSTSGSGVATRTSSSAAAGEAHPEAVVKLASPNGSGAHGEAVIARVGSALEIAIEAHGLSPGKGATYIVWLYNSPGSFLAVGRAPAVESNGRLPGSASTLPEGAAGYHKLIITRESSALPTHPGEIVLEGKLSLGTRGGG